MRVCILAPEFSPTWGGIGTYTHNLARGLADRADVHVVTTKEGARAAAGDTPEGVQVHAFPGDGVHHGSLGLSFQMSVFRRLPRLARIHDFDVIHANHAYMSDLLVRARRLEATPVVTVHTTLGTQIEGTLRADENVQLRGRERTLARWRPLAQGVERFYLRRTPALIFVSRYVRDHAASHYRLQPRASTVIPNGVDTERLANGGTPREEPAGEPVLLFAGRMLALKGLGTLLRALARLDSRVHLMLAGPGDPAPWVGLAQRLGLDGDRCRFLGPVPHADMPHLYHRADAVVLPSFSESCPMVALEAMASGVPLIAAGVGGVGEIVQDGSTGWLFPPGDVDGLVDRIRSVLADPARARRVSGRARAWVDANASVDRMAERTFRFYETACGGAS
ncbi:MAG TPA: glycosyltransferase family 4 protein [Thermoplasmata archaeon]|nr:glycosyltransferase family 4 protein [Thermoplasmata archaeon]